jgi:hypothetical protein
VPLPAFSLSNTWKVAKLTSAISSSPSVTCWPSPTVGAIAGSAVGTAAADAPPTIENVKPAAPSTGTDFIACFFFDVCLARGIVATSIPLSLV